MNNQFHDEEVCDCGSVKFFAITCPEIKKYIDQCAACGDCGSHLCDDITCPSNEELAQRLKDEEAVIEGEARYRESVLGDEGRIGYANPDYLDSSDDFEGDLG
jgi:hypothetical protein